MTDEQQTSQPRRDPKVVAAKQMPSRAELQKTLAKITDDYKWLYPEASAGHGPAITERHALAKEMKAVAELLHLSEPDVEVTVTRSATGHAFAIGDTKYPPGKYTVKASVAQQLLWMMDANRRQELALLKQNGYDVDLSGIASRAQYAVISQEDSDG